MNAEAKTFRMPNWRETKLWGMWEIFTDQTNLFWNGHLILGMSGPKIGVLDVSPGKTAQEIILYLLQCKTMFISLKFGV